MELFTFIIFLMSLFPLAMRIIMFSSQKEKKNIGIWMVAYSKAHMYILFFNFFQVYLVYIREVITNFCYLLGTELLNLVTLNSVTVQFGISPVV